MSPKKAFGRFAKALASATTFSVGIAWDERNGWRSYQAADGAVLFMTPKTGRHIVSKFYEYGALPANSSAWSDLKDTFDELRRICDEADARNAAKEIPPDGLKFMRPGGQA